MEVLLYFKVKRNTTPYPLYSYGKKDWDTVAGHLKYVRVEVATNSALAVLISTTVAMPSFIVARWARKRWRG